MSNIRILNNISLYNSITAASGVRTPEIDGVNSKLIIKPDPTVNNDQYLIVEPTGTSDIHIRAGGDIDNSGAQLRLGGEYNHVEVSDSGHSTTIVTGKKDTSNNWHTNSGGWVFKTDELVDGSVYKHSLSLPTSAHIGNDGDVATWHGNLNILGNLNLAGSATFHNTDYTTTSAISVTNTGTGPALVVNQTGEQAVAAFYDDNSIAFYIDGKSATAGNVGIGTSTPNEKLTVVGNISSTGTMYVSAVNDLKVTTWGSGTVKLSNKVDGDNIYIQSTNVGRSILRWHSRADYGSGNSGQFSQIQAQDDGVWIKNESWSGGNYHHKWHFDNYGSITFPILDGNSRTGNGENLQFVKSGNQKVISTAVGTVGQPTVERLVIAGGDSYYDSGTSTYAGEGGDVYLWAGKGDNGGDVKVQAGEGITQGGYLRMHAGDTLSGNAGFVELYAGDSYYGNAGNVQIRAGNSVSGYGAYVNINAGCGPLGNGNITLQTCQGGTHQLVLSSTGELITPNNLVVYGTISASGGILGVSTIQKVVSTFGNGADTLYEVVHNLATEDVVVSIIDTATKEVVYPSVVNYSLSSIKVEFAVAPSSNAYKAVIIG